MRRLLSGLNATSDAGETCPPSDVLNRRWIVISALSAIAFTIGGAGAVAIGLCIDPIMSEFHWTNGRTSSITTAFLLASLVASPVIGRALDRVGACSVMKFGIIAVATGFLAASRCHSYIPMTAACAWAGIGYVAAYYIPTTVVVANWMGIKKNFGMGLIMASTSVGAAIFSPAIGWSIEKWGWRVTLEILAVLAASMLPLVLLFVKTSPCSITPSEEEQPAVTDKRDSGRSAMFSSTFVMITTCSVLFNIGMGGILYHVVAILIGAGFSPHAAGLVYGGTWLLSALGSLVFGAVADRLGTKAVLVGALLWGSVGTLCLLGVGVAGIGMVCVGAFVLLWGTSANGVSQFVPVLFAERFGRQQLGTLVGVQSAVAGVAGSTAPIVTGLLYDGFHSYRAAIDVSSGVTLAAALLLLTLRASAREGSRSAEDVQS